MLRFAAGLLCAALGMGAGYFLWGDRAAALATILDRFTLEYDALRMRAGADTGASGQSVASVLESLSSRVREQGEKLAQQTEALSRIVGDRDTQVAESLRSCDEIQTKIQEQLETCLFVRAELEHQLTVAKQAAAPRPAGRQTVTESVEVPTVPTKLNKDSIRIPRNVAADAARDEGDRARGDRDANAAVDSNSDAESEVVKDKLLVQP